MWSVFCSFEPYWLLSLGGVLGGDLYSGVLEQWSVPIAVFVFLGCVVVEFAVEGIGVPPVKPGTWFPTRRRRIHSMCACG